ncbi:hypothetical protein DBV10_12080 [Acidovorax sp. FJL06]|nr:hypothetical protein DBV10_12080 [Acidovorax sp. FJL06]
MASIVTGSSVVGASSYRRREDLAVQFKTTATYPSMCALLKRQVRYVIGVRLTWGIAFNVSERNCPNSLSSQNDAYLFAEVIDRDLIGLSVGRCKDHFAHRFVLFAQTTGWIYLDA